MALGFVPVLLTSPESVVGRLSAHEKQGWGQGGKIQNFLPLGGVTSPPGTNRTLASRGTPQSIKTQSGSKISTEPGQQVSSANFPRTRMLGLPFGQEKAQFRR